MTLSLVIIKPISGTTTYTKIISSKSVVADNCYAQIGYEVSN